MTKRVAGRMKWRIVAPDPADDKQTIASRIFDTRAEAAVALPNFGSSNGRLQPVLVAK